jgi:hypothetical protein
MKGRRTTKNPEIQALRAIQKSSKGGVQMTNGNSQKISNAVGQMRNS